MKKLLVIFATVCALALPGKASAATYFGSIDDNEFADLWLLTVGGVTPSLVTISTQGSPNTASGYPLNTELFLFDSNFFGIVSNDDVLADQGYSGLVAALAPGNYYLAISLYNSDPSNGPGQNIFPDNTFGLNTPTAYGLGNPWTGGWTTQWPEGYPYNGDYVLTITGVDSAAPVPEPATLTLLGSGAAALMRRAWKRRASLVA
jgi:hypothetical protein